jgi:hypothetical protein
MSERPSEFLIVLIFLWFYDCVHHCGTIKGLWYCWCTVQTWRWLPRVAFFLCVSWECIMKSKHYFWKLQCRPDWSGCLKGQVPGSFKHSSRSSGPCLVQLSDLELIRRPPCHGDNFRTVLHNKVQFGSPSKPYFRILLGFILLLVLTWLALVISRRGGGSHTLSL